MKMKIVPFIFAFVCILTSSVYAQDKLDCTQFKIGKFDTYVNGKVSAKVVRTKKYQSEYIPKTGAKVKLEITWIDECEYKLVFVKANKKFYELRGDEKIYPELVVTITEVNGWEYYHESRFIGVDDFVYKAKVVKTK